MEQSQCSKDSGVDVSKITKIDKAVLEMRVDASAGQGIAVRRGAGRIRHIAAPTLWVIKAHARRHRQNHENPWSLEPGRSWNQTPQSGKHWRDVIVTLEKKGLEVRCEQKCRKSRNPILKFPLITMHVKLTLSRKRKWTRNSIDHESSDAVILKQLRDQMVYIHRESPRSTTQTEPEQTTTQCNQTVRCQPDHNNIEHNFGQDCTELFMFLTF